MSIDNSFSLQLTSFQVYLPCVLLAKKRYVGFKYENPDDKEPVFDAKGIETVRRDGVPAQQKMTETSLKYVSLPAFYRSSTTKLRVRILFRSQDLSQVKDYCCTTWAQIIENRVSLQDFIFAKEVRLGTYRYIFYHTKSTVRCRLTKIIGSNDVPPPPGVAVATRRMMEDPNDEPQYGDRIPYVIVRGDPGLRLVDRAMPPEAVLNSRSVRHTSSCTQESFSPCHLTVTSGSMPPTTSQKSLYRRLSAYLI